MAGWLLLFRFNLSEILNANITGFAKNGFTKMKKVVRSAFPAHFQALCAQRNWLAGSLFGPKRILFGSNATC
jgi:hypothetical protein